VWIKAAGWALEEVRPHHVHLLDPAGRVVDGPGRPHNEYPIHTEVMEARGDVGGVVHTHAPFATALAASGQPLRPIGHAATMFVPPDVPRFEATGDLILTPELGRRVADALGDAPALFLVNHGIVTVGPDLPSATVAAVMLERACQQQLQTAAAGGWPTWSDPAEATTKRANIFSPDSVASTWDYLVRHVISQPDKGSDEHESSHHREVCG